jgi:gluconate 5-dehydrogenase
VSNAVPERSSASDLLQLDGVVALVTGATGGIGFAVAEALSAAGATVVLHGRSPDPLATAAAQLRDRGRQVATVEADFSDPAAVAALVPRVLAEVGDLRVLVNCAGVNNRQPTLAVDAQTYDRILAVNLRAPFVLSQEAARHMVGRGGGRIVNVGSLTTMIGLSGITVYGLTKAALGQMTRQLAVEWAPHGILVNCVMPGFLRTRLTEEVWADERRRRWMLDRIPLQRGGDAREVAAAVLFLASPAASYITGVCLPVDGGILAGMPGYESGSAE